MQSNPEAPRAPKRPHEITEHGQSWQDDWFWLREKTDEKVIQYLKDENAYAKAFFSPHEELKETLYREIRGRIPERDSSAPQKDGPFHYYHRYEENAEYPLYCRKRIGAGEEVYFNGPEEAEGKSHWDLGVLAVSPQHNKVVIGVDENGSEKYTLRVRDLTRGVMGKEEIPGCHTSVTWAADGTGFFYVKLDEQLRPQKVYFHVLGADVNEDHLVYEEKDNRFFVGVGRTLDRKYTLIHSQGSHVSEVYFLDGAQPKAEPTCLAPRSPGVEYDVCHRKGVFYIRTNRDSAKDFKVMTCPASKPGPENWEELIPHSAGTLITSVEAFQNHLVIEKRRDALPQIEVRTYNGETSYEISHPEATYDVETGGYREFGTTTLRFYYSSFVTPMSVFDFDMHTQKRTLVKQREVLGGYDATQYEVVREEATAEDGARIPISILYKKGAVLDGSAQLYLNGYGSYGITQSAGFSSARLSLVDRGFVYAIAHIRGSMTRGWDWYENGKKLSKKNTFNDFIACAEHLAKKGYTSTGQVTAMGGSAGGMLMGVVANERPDLFKTIVAHVPFVDVLNTMLDDSLTLTPIEWDEWGNPKEKEYFDYIRSYSPYDNVRAQEYPHMFITAGLHDPRVTYWEPAKWVAKLRDLKTDKRWLVLKTKMDSGHAGSSGRWESLKEVAEEYAFVLSV